MISRIGDLRRGLLWGSLGLALAAPARAQLAEIPATPPRPLRVMIQVRPNACVVGQSVEVAVGVIGDQERPKVTAPRLTDATLGYLRTELVPMNLNAIGGMVRGQSLYRFRYRLTPKTAGVLTIPPFAATLEGRRGASTPVRLHVQPLPTAGRPADFLGGVGSFQVEASAVPGALRTGETFEYRLTIEGPGARGVRSAPDLARLASLPLGLRVERLADVATDEPPSHRFTYRLRPTKPGRVTLPSVSVSAFDPTIGRYVTQVASGVPVRVEDIPRFDAEALSYREETGAESTDPNPLQTELLPLTSAVGLAVGLGLVLAIRWRRRGATTRALRGLARRLATQTADAIDAEAAGRILTEGLVEALRLMIGRPPGALTPDEAAAGIALATGSETLAATAARLARRWDRARFRDPGDDPDGLVAEGVSFFEELAKAGLRNAREAVGSAGEKGRTPGDCLS